MSEEVDFFGMCHKCGDKVLGEGNGCSALGEVYHVSCFTCVVCSQPLRGKQFYAINVSVTQLVYMIIINQSNQLVFNKFSTI